MTTGLVTLAVIMFVSNVLTVYFTFRAWYGPKRGKGMMEVWYDDEGHIKFEESAKPLNNKNEVHHYTDMD